MIYLNKDDNNTFALTLDESVTIANPYFLFKFEWEFDLSLDAVYWVGTDTSPYPERYNLFDLEEGVDATFRIGQYIYTVYESVDPSPVDETGLTELEEGRMVVAGTSSTIYE